MWLSSLFGKRSFGSRSRMRACRTAKHVRPRLEALEDRLAPATLSLTNTLDDGSAGSLRWAIALASADAANNVSDIIEFDTSLSGQTITLTNGQLELRGAGGGKITIDGTSLSTPIAISGNNASSIFYEAAGVQAELDHLTLKDASGYFGGAIFNAGTLTVNGSTLSGNSCTDYYSGSGGGIFNAGTMIVTDSTLSGNSGTSGGGVHNEGSLTLKGGVLSGNKAVSGYFGWGGGIFNSGTLTIENNTTLSANFARAGGGVFNEGTLTVDNSALSGNLAVGNGNGGGVFNDGSLTLNGSQATRPHLSAAPSQTAGRRRSRAARYRATPPSWAAALTTRALGP